MTILIQVRAPHSAAGEAIVERIQGTLPARMKSVTGSLPDRREAPGFSNVLLIKFGAPADNAKHTGELAIDWFRTDPRKMDVVLLRGDRDDLAWWDMIASTTDPTVARHLIGERPGE